METTLLCEDGTVSCIPSDLTMLSVRKTAARKLPVTRVGMPLDSCLAESLAWLLFTSPITHKGKQNKSSKSWTLRQCPQVASRGKCVIFHINFGGVDVNCSAAAKTMRHDHEILWHESDWSNFAGDGVPCFEWGETCEQTCRQTCSTGACWLFFLSLQAVVVGAVHSRSCWKLVALRLWQT